MSADVFSSLLGLTLQGTGNNANAWGTILNESLRTIERRLAGNIVRAVTGGTLDLSANPPPAAVSKVLDFEQIFTGDLTANQIVIIPNISGCWQFINETTGSFQLLLQVPNGAFINIPQGTAKLVTCDGAGNLLRADRDQVGNFEYNSVVKPGTLQCSGQSLLKSDFPDLFETIGVTYGSADALHFTLPNLTDKGRFLRSTTDSLTVGTYQASQNLSHTHTGSGTTGNESAAHTHTGSGTTGMMNQNDPHSHAVGGGTIGGAFLGLSDGKNSGTPIGGGPIVIQSTSINHNHNFSFTTGSPSVSHTHDFSFTTSTGSADGTEARPEGLVVIVSIRY